MSSAGRSRSADRPGRPTGNDGFTLLELMAVLVVVGLAAGIAMPSISTGLQRWRLRTAALEMNSMLKFTRTQAVAKRQAFQLVLDRSRNLYWLDRPNTVMDAEQAHEKGIRLFALPSGVRFGAVTLGGQETHADELGMVFSPYGTTMASSVQIVDERGHGYQITLDEVTGRSMIRRIGTHG